MKSRQSPTPQSLHRSQGGSTDEMTCRWPLTTRVTGFNAVGLEMAGEGDIAIVDDEAASVPTPAPRVHPPTTNAMTKQSKYCIRTWPATDR